MRGATAVDWPQFAPRPAPRPAEPHRLWQTRSRLAVDLLAWAQTILLHDFPPLARDEPKTLRYRLLPVAARLVRSGRRLRLFLDATWPSAAHLAAAFHRRGTLPQPAH